MRAIGLRSHQHGIGCGARCLLFCLLVCTPHALTAQQTAADAVSRADADHLAKRIEQARLNGYWIVAEGEHLYRICRYFYPDDRTSMERLREYLIKRNGHVFLNGKPSLLIVGARLYLPPELLRSQPGAVPQPRASPQPSTQSAQEIPQLPSSTGAASNVPVPTALRSLQSPADTAYIDQLIGGAADAEPEAADQEQRDETPGARSLSLTVRTETRQPPGRRRASESGVDLRYSWETLDYGDYYLDAGLHTPDGTLNSNSTVANKGGRITLYQNRLPLTQHWLADSAVGHLRTPPNLLINNSYRTYLPTSLLQGASTTVYDSANEFRVYAGTVGKLEGSTGQSFTNTTGRIAGLGYMHRGGQHWKLGGELISLRGSTTSPNTDNVTLATEYRNPAAGQGHKVQLLADSDSRVGAWYDGDVAAGRARHRFGLFQLDPGISWGDSALPGDARGAYLRTDYRTLGHTISAGADLNENNIRDDASKAKTSSSALYGSFTMRLDRTLSTGAGLTVQKSKARYSVASDSRSTSGNAFLAWNGLLGLSRFDVARFDVRPDNGVGTTTDTFSWSHEWPEWSALSFSTTLNHSIERLAAGPTYRTSLGITLRGPASGSLTWDASAVLARVENDAGIEQNFNLSGGAQWSITRNWTGQANLSWTTIDPLPPLPGLERPQFQRDKRLMLGVRYERSSGIPYQTLGIKPGSGSGRVEGTVFFDDNDDGLRQPTERGASGITVYLDGRLPATTGSDGRFNFPIVTPGSHSLRILNETLPLPWTLDEERRLSFSVPLRGEARIDVPLSRIRP